MYNINCITNVYTFPGATDALSDVVTWNFNDNIFERSRNNSNANADNN